MNGIRTHGIIKYNGLANQRFKPLSHHSGKHIYNTYYWT
jgi:hypothetical protein